jgi:hypothetical protein
MISSVSSNSPVNQHQQQVHQAQPAQKPKQAEPQDTVVLSHKAQGGADADHDGD